MAEIYFDSPMTDAERREALYAGAIFVYRPTAVAREFCAFADGLIREAFGGLDPETAQYELPVERYIGILQELKPHFIHHPESKRLVAEILAERGCNSTDTYFDVPRMRSSTSDGYLTSGIAYAWHPHRDTWYSAPGCQINWWTPIYPITPRNGMSFYLEFFDKVVPNDSDGYDYAVWNARHRFAAASQVKKDTRPLPGPKNEIDEGKGTILVCEVGGLIVFSAAQLHASVPNDSGKTRFSIDFRTVNLGDCRKGVGAPAQDVACTGSSIRDFKRARDLEDIPDEVALALEGGA
ncbi:hypothetical protein [Lentisalinibacter orientalis]|uniref:hypothetical protein n=1 Tax=Lentisalinibacter orientalis TaxID=2992241 RepID=UPI00386E653C